MTFSPRHILAAIVASTCLAIPETASANPCSPRELEHRRALRRIAMSVLAGLLAFVAMTATPAAANPPGVNGQIAFSRYNQLLEETTVYTVNPDGSHEQQLLPLPFECARWSPDGAQIATCGGPDGSSSALIDPDDGSYRELVSSDPTLLLACFVWSPDAQRLACESSERPLDPSRDGMYSIRSSDGGGVRRISSNPDGHDQPGDFSPEGKRLVFARFDDREGADPVGLYVVKVDDQRLRPLTAPGTIVTSPGAWSPQGNEIVFSRHVSGDLRNSLWTVHADGSGLREIQLAERPCGGAIADATTSGCFDPRWSPDGTKIVFNIFSPATGEIVYTANADGTALTQITFSGEDEVPDWGSHPLAR